MTRALLVMLAVVTVAGSPAAQAPRTPHSRTRVVMLGTGNPNADPDRFGPATVIIVDSRAYLVDAGVGVVRRWAAAIRRGAGPFKPWSLRRLFVTHLHSDHTLGYADLILSSWTLEQGEPQPLRVYGPTGIRSMTEHLLAAYAEDIQIRTGASGERAGSARPLVEVHEIMPGVVYRDSLVTVTAFRVHHGTWEQAFGFRFQTPDKDIVISGDAAPPSAIPAQCHGCDILIHEGAIFHSGVNAYQSAFHTSMEELVDVAKASRPKLLVLYHQRPGPNTAGLEFIRSRYDGRVVVANDLDVFE
jgi:ribonuclease Z